MIGFFTTDALAACKEYAPAKMENVRAEEKRTCSVCGGPITKKNSTGICRRNSDCERAETLAYYTKNKKRLLALAAKRYKIEHPQIGKCARCGGPIQCNNKIGICSRNDNCARDSNNARHKILQALIVASRPPMEKCSICSGPIGPNKIGICTRNPNCKRAASIARTKTRLAIRVANRTPARKCSNCGNTIARYNKNGICPNCRKAANLVLREARIAQMEKCSECGGPMRIDNTMGICTKNPDCQRVARAIRAAIKPRHIPIPKGKCSECGGPIIAKSNKIGICSKNARCLKISRNLQYKNNYEKQKALHLNYLGECCVLSGSKLNPDTHHLDRADKVYTVSGNYLRGIEVNKPELDKCVLLHPALHFPARPDTVNYNYIQNRFLPFPPKERRYTGLDENMPPDLLQAVKKIQEEEGIDARL